MTWRAKNTNDSVPLSPSLPLFENRENIENPLVQYSPCFQKEGENFYYPYF